MTIFPNMKKSTPRFTTLFLLFTLTMVFTASAQLRRIKIVEEAIPNRIQLYALNENEQDLDVMLTVKGTNIRQSRAPSRFTRVPGASKVLLKTLILVRGKEPSYTYKLEVKDSLSTRSLKREYEPIKIRPRKPITVYLPENCASCDSLILPMDQGKYLYTSHDLKEKPEIKEQLKRLFRDSTALDTLSTPIINLGGKLLFDVTSYEELLEEMNMD